MQSRHVEVVHGDITKLDVDAIVNAANPALAGGGGVDGAIHAAAGATELQAACSRLGGCEPGDAKATPGFALPARWIIHTVGPIWRGGDQGESDILASCYLRSMEVADGLGATEIAFPAISTGVYGFPRDLAADIALQSTRRSPAAVKRVMLVAHDLATLRLYEERLADG